MIMRETLRERRNPPSCMQSVDPGSLPVKASRSNKPPAVGSQPDSIPLNIRHLWADEVGATFGTADNAPKEYYISSTISYRTCSTLSGGLTQYFI